METENSIVEGAQNIGVKYSNQQKQKRTNKCNEHWY